MSLKAKLEAVIYAAEEPVTLTQLAVLFAADALEWKAAQQAAAAEQAAEAAGEPPEYAQPASQPAEGLEYLGLEDMAGMRAAESETPAPAEPQAEAAGEPADPEAEARRLARQRDREVKGILRQLLDELIASCVSDSRGVEIREIAGGYRMATKPECHDAVRLLLKSLKPPLKLSLPALETLAVVAYKQPVTAPEVNEIRGVESGGVLGSLLARKLIATAGRKQVIGRPILYKTTREFLLRFGLKDLSELPSMEEFEKMATAEIEEMEPEAVAADAGEAPAGDLDEKAAGNDGADDRAVLEEDSPRGEEVASELAEAESNGKPAAGEETAGTPNHTATTSNEPDAGPAGAQSAPAENEAVPHAQEEKDERGD